MFTGMKAWRQNAQDKHGYGLGTDRVKLVGLWLGHRSFKTSRVMLPQNFTQKLYGGSDTFVCKIKKVRRKDPMNLYYIFILLLKLKCVA